MATPIIFFGNEKLATGITDNQPVILEAVRTAGFEIEQHITGPLSELKPHKAEIAVLAAYGRIIPQSVLDQFPLGIINIHPSLLPAYRGPTPIEQAMLDGVPETGVSIMQLTAGMDEGPVFKQKTLHLKGNETKAELVKSLQKLGAELLVEVLPSIIKGSLKPRQQPHPDRATYSHKITKDDGVIDWNKSAEQIEREVRTFSDWPKSRTTIADKDVIITKAHSVPVNHPENKPGDIDIQKDVGVLMIECGNGYLCIDKLKPAGKNEMTAAAFIAGYGHLLKS